MNKLIAVLIVLFIQTDLLAQEQTNDIDELLKQFSIGLTKLKKDKQILGLAAGIVKNNQLIWSEGYGFADSDRTVRMTADTPIWIASVSKTFVGLAFLKLESEGLIDLSEQASATPNFNSLCDWLSSTTIAFAKDLNCKAKITIQNILNHQVNGMPGTNFMYNPIMYSRLSRFLEHKFGLGVDAVEGRHNYLAQTIDRVILTPAGMTRTMSSQWDRQKPMVYFDIARGHGVVNGDYLAKRSPERHIAGGAGVVSTVLDLAKYDIALNTDSIVDKKIRNKLFTPAKFTHGDDSPYGFGWYVQTFKNKKLVWHSGWDAEAGYSALLLKVPDESITFILLANSEGIWWNNPLDKAEVHKSAFAKLFLDTFVFNEEFGAPKNHPMSMK